MSKSRFRKTKIIVASIYILILIVYAFFLSQVYISNQSGDHLQLFGNYYLSMEDDNNSLTVVSKQDEYQKSETIVYTSSNESSNQTQYKIGEIDSVIVQNDVKVVTVSYGDQKEYISYNQIYGTIVKQISNMGSVLNFLQSALGIAIIVIIPCGIFLIYQLISLILYVRRNKANYSYQDYDTEEPEDIDYSDDDFSSLSEEKEVNEDTRETKAPSNELFGKFLESEKLNVNNNDNENLDSILSELRYKMQFQDTNQLSKHIESDIEKQEEEVKQDLNTYGLQTSVIEDGIEISIDRLKTENLILQLKNDGSLTIITENYQAEISSDIN